MSKTKKVLLVKNYKGAGLSSYHKVIPAGIYEVVVYAGVYKIVSEGIYKGENLPKEICQIAKEYSMEYVTKLEIKAALGDRENERLRKQLDGTADVIKVKENALTQLKDANDELAALISQQAKELEEAKQAMDEPRHNLLFKYHNERNRLEAAQRESRQLFKKLEEAKEVLRWYSAPEFYEAAHKLTEGATHVLDDCGERARSFLEGEGNQEEMRHLTPEESESYERSLDKLFNQK